MSVAGSSSPPPRVGCAPRPAYRVLLTGVPRGVGAEELYAHLRAHLTHRALPGLVNALLLRVPGEGGVGPSASSAFVDFASKAAAEAAMAGRPLSRAVPSTPAGGQAVDLAGARLRWQPLGPVVAGEGSLAAVMGPAAVAAEEEGRRAYAVFEGASNGGGRGAREAGESNATALRLPRCEGGERKGDTPPPRGDTSDEVAMRLVADRPLSQLYSFNHDGEVCLFNDIERALRKEGMGLLCSLQRISDTEVHITVDRETADYLREREGAQRGSVRLCSAVRTSTLNSTCDDLFCENPRPSENCPISEGLSQHAGLAKRNGELTDVHWEVRRARLSFDIAVMLSNRNLSLASKSEVLAAMARLMERSSGKFGAIRDAYGNLLFPS